MLLNINHLYLCYVINLINNNEVYILKVYPNTRLCYAMVILYHESEHRVYLYLKYVLFVLI